MCEKGEGGRGGGRENRRQEKRLGGIWQGTEESQKTRMRPGSREDAPSILRLKDQAGLSHIKSPEGGWVLGRENRRNR